jgi:diguanylate cyclase (GGDEF)-like protein
MDWLKRHLTIKVIVKFLGRDLHLRKRRQCLTIIFILSLAGGKVWAESVREFIQSAQVETFDCPSDESMQELENWLSRGDLASQDLIDLTVIKGQGLICIGQFEPAKKLLKDVLSDDLIDHSTYAYASALYQLGFIHDVQENPVRCQYYAEARQAAMGQFRDVVLSAELGEITVCGSDNQNVGLKLAKLFALLESYLRVGDKAAIAHIHNNIGLLYGDIGQNALAAEQYEKSYKIGLEVYEQKNQMAPLFSVISAYTGSGDFANAKLMIDELERANKLVNTPLTNSWLHFTRSRYFYVTKQFDQMRNSLRDWQPFLVQVSNKQMAALHALYSAALCMHDDDRKCVENFITQRAEVDAKHASRLSANKDYLRFLVSANLYLGDIGRSQDAFERYAETLTEKLHQQQSSAQVLGVANLYSEIISLEDELNKAQQQRIQFMVLIVALVILMGLAAYWGIGRRYLRGLHTDMLTGLRTEQSVLAAIRRVKAPMQDRINALAVFDLSNFTEVNAQFGYMAGDMLLKTVASCLQQVTREHDLVGRLGADQFVVCLKNIEDHTATELFERIQKVLGDTVLDAGRGERVNVHSSMHIYLAPDNFSDLDQVLLDLRQAASKKTSV